MAGGRASEADTLPTLAFSYLLVAGASAGSANLSSVPALPAIRCRVPRGAGAQCRGHPEGRQIQPPTDTDGSQALSA